MSKKRMIDTRFWSDGWVRRLNALDRYLFLYLISNEKCSFCGIYELPLSTMAYECGLDERDLEKTMLPRLEPKVYYHDGWVVLRNFKKHHVSEGSVNSMKGYESALSEVPNHIIEYVSGLDKPLQAPSSPSGTSTIAFASTIASTSASSKAVKGAYGEFQNVLLHEEEYAKLISLLNENAVTILIAELDGYIESTGKRYKSHYATLQNWARRRIQEHTTRNKPLGQKLTADFSK